MSDLIDRQEAIALFYKHPNIDWTTLDVMNELKSLPTADAVKVVRCKDCKHYLPNENACHIDMTGGWQDDDFCSCGERKETDDAAN